MQYDEALARNKAASKPGLSSWLPDTRGAPSGYTPISPMMSRPQLLNPEVAAVGNYWVGQGPDMDADKHRPNGVKTGVCSLASLGPVKATFSASRTASWSEAAASQPDKGTAAGPAYRCQDPEVRIAKISFQPSRRIALPVQCCKASGIR